MDTSGSACPGTQWWIGYNKQAACTCSSADRDMEAIASPACSGCCMERQQGLGQCIRGCPGRSLLHLRIPAWSAASRQGNTLAEEAVCQ